MNRNQSICTVCGQNKIDSVPDYCPFCGANRNKFVSCNEAQQIYKVVPYRINNYVTQLRSMPRFSLNHAAYRIETDDAAVWIDCPSIFNPDLKPVEAIYFTHNEFMGASNQYREAWNAKVYLHALNAEHSLAKQFPVDRRFEGDKYEHGIEAFHIGGHTPGFTLYIYGKVLFICDNIFTPGFEIRFNPFGPHEETRRRAARIQEIISERCLRLASQSLNTVCGYNFVTEFDEWRKNFQCLLEEHSSTVA